MSQNAIFSPFFAMILLTFIVWVYMYVRRIRFITSRKLTPKEMEPIAFAQISPPSVSNPSDNLKNLFEIPILFYALVLYLFATKQVDTIYLTLPRAKATGILNDSGSTAINATKGNCQGCP